MKKGFVRLQMLDSGAFSFRKLFRDYQRRYPNRGLMDFYDSEFFWDYIDSYCRFVKRYQLAIDRYVNLDVIGNPELTYRNHLYMEQQGLHPLPAVHACSDPDLKWFWKYVEKGYTYIGVGGIVGKIKNPEVMNWFEKLFRAVCPPPSYLPIVRLHGFGVMAAPMLHRFPFYSCDATNVGKLGWYGKVFIPRSRGGEFDFTANPFVVALSDRVKGHNYNIHYKKLSYKKQGLAQYVRRWLRYIDETHFYNRPLNFDKTNDDYMAANYYYLHRVVESLPDWPWAFGSDKRSRIVTETRPFRCTSFRPSLLDVRTGPTETKPMHPSGHKVILYLSGSYNGEDTLQKLGLPSVNRMLTYYDSYQSSKGIDKQLLSIYKDRGGKHTPSQQKKKRRKIYDKKERNKDIAAGKSTTRAVAEGAKKQLHPIGRTTLLESVHAGS